MATATVPHTPPTASPGDVLLLASGRMVRYVRNAGMGQIFIADLGDENPRISNTAIALDDVVAVISTSWLRPMPELVRPESPVWPAFYADQKTGALIAVERR